MLFYIALFVACVIVSVAFLYLFKALENVGKEFHETPVQSIRTRHANRQKQRSVPTTVNQTPTPWGWSGAGKPDHAARTRPVMPNASVPWGWQGSHYAKNGHGAIKGAADRMFKHLGDAAKEEKIVHPGVGWPYREEKFKFAGRDYKVVRRVAPEPTDLSNTGKPWGW